MSASNLYKIISITFLAFLSYTIAAQDTITVQTLTYDSTGRNYMFTFPNEPIDSYEKILMEYSMRCKGQLISTGSNTNLGCGEWDFSCNTFITDTTRIDSNTVFHPTHTITNFSDESFDFSNQPTYTYYEFDQQEVTYANVISENVVTAGAGTMQLPLDANAKTAKMQYLYETSQLASSGLNAGDINALRLDVSSIGEEISFLRIKMKNTSKSTLEAANPDVDEFTEVYFLNTTFDATGWQQFNFYEDFDWDGTSNILVELSYTRAGSGMPNTVKMHDAGFDAALITSNDDYALKFDGTGVVNVPAAPLSVISDQITIALWTFGDASVLPRNTYLFEGVDDNLDRQVNVHLPWSNGQVFWDCGNDGSGYDRINKTANEQDFEGRWNHWAFTKNATSGIMKIFLNGEEWHSGTGKNKLIDITRFKLAASQNVTQFYNGQIDEFSIWDKTLNAAEIQALMRESITPAHPDYANLLAYYSFDEGQGTMTEDLSSNALNPAIDGFPGWNLQRGNGLHKGFNTSTLRPNIAFVQGDYVKNVATNTVLDSVQNTLRTVIEYGVQNGDLIVLDTLFLYPGGISNVFNENGVIVNLLEAPYDGTINVGELQYFDKFHSKYEILSLVTPYGINLDLGEGKTFTIDVTEYAPILQNDRRLSVELGGQNQEELDIKFLFIKGTPPRDVIDIQNIWPFRRGWFDVILNDRVFEPRMVTMPTQGSQYKLRSSVTGHGQNGEFVSRNHYLNIAGGTQEFTYDVWKECADNPIFPQGGTWLFDRAGWCPGSATDVHQFDITDLVTSGQPIEIDYGVNGLNMTEANYLVSNQLVTYGPPNFNQDAAVIDIKRPSGKVEYERINPACNAPIVTIQNTGSTDLTSVEIEYSVDGGIKYVQKWEGNLAFLETADVTLPIHTVSFWSTVGDDGKGVFVASVKNPNEGSDEYSNNNTMRSAFDLPTIINREVNVEIRTNNRGNENRYTIKDKDGNVILSRDNMTSNTTYKDVVELTPGCYTFEFLDDGDDGLFYWYYGAIGQNVGSGSVALTEVLNPQLTIPFTTFDSEFGRSVQYDFSWGGYLTNVEPALESFFSIAPNPSTGLVVVDMQGFENQDIRITVFDVGGRMVFDKSIDNNPDKELKEQIDLNNQPAGMYYIKVFDGKKIRVRPLALQR